MKFERIFTLVPCEYTYFLSREIPDNLKLNKEYIKLNFGHLSPFKEYDVLFFKEGNKLYIWFIDGKAIKKDVTVFIPESLLYSIILKENFHEGILLLHKRNKNISCIFILNKGEIVDIITTKSSITKDFISLLKKKFFNLEVIELDPQDIKFNKIKLLLKIIKIIIQNSKITKRRTVIKKVIQLTNAVLLSALIVKLILLLTINFKINAQKEKISKLQQKVYQVASEYFFIEKNAQIWLSLEKKLYLRKLINIMRYILNILAKYNLEIKSISVTPRNLTLNVISKTPSFLKELNQLKNIGEIHIISSQPFGNRTRYKIQIQLSSINTEGEH